MLNKTITFLGVGHIAHAIIEGLFRGKTLDNRRVILSGPHLDRFADLKKKYGVGITTNNREAVKNAEIIFIGVRPKVVKEVVTEIKNHIRKDALIISVAAGVTFSLMKKYFNRTDIKLVRIMPNIPVSYGLGVVGWVGEGLSLKDKTFVETLLKPLGLTIGCEDEKAMDKLSMISGCGIGYASYFMKNLEKIAESYGSKESEARKIVLNTFAGTLKHLEITGESPEELTTAVTTKGGITKEVLESMDSLGFYKIFSESVKKGYVKIKRLTKEMQ